MSCFVAVLQMCVTSHRGGVGDSVRLLTFEEFQVLVGNSSMREEESSVAGDITDETHTCL
jgi:hypothetical protein